MAVSRKRRPRLDRAVLVDPDALDQAHAHLLADDPNFRSYRRRILKRQRRLRDLATDDAWQAYLKVEEATSSRLAYVMDTVTEWAFLQGRRR